MTASHPEAVDLYREPMYKLDLVKLDPFAYILILGGIARLAHANRLRM
jgi:hypothetical protein